MKYSTNEWDKLQQVIVGTATGARVPELDKSLHCVNYAGGDEVVAVGPYPDQVIAEANEDLETFCDFLRGESVEVLRPTTEFPVEYYDYCPRDIAFVHGDTAIATPNPIKARANNWKNIGSHITDMQIISPDFTDDDYDERCIGDPNTLACAENQPMFDAANIIRANEDLLYLVSNSGNKRGAHYLQGLLGNSARVHTLEGVYSYMHIDSTVAFLREGLMLLNPSRIKSKDQLPEPFRSWDAIWCPEPTDIGYYGNYCNASEWINMNLFSVNSNLVVLEENQHNLRAELEKHNIDCAMLPIRHQRTLGGGFHCVTLDTKRCGN